MIERARRLARRLPKKNNQKGFTLIEMLVVISILGILAAVVTMSMIGVVNRAQTSANTAEQRTVQAALDTMANEQQLDENSICSGGSAGGTNNMNAFPPNGISPSPGASPPAIGTAVVLYPRYLRTQNTHQNYVCTNTGVVSAP